MKTKMKLLTLFEENKGVYLSGEKIAHILSITRSAVWKAVNALRADGYSIDAVTNKGYCLLINNDILSEQGIRKYLNYSTPAMDFEIMNLTDSTNIQVRKKAVAGYPEGYVCLASAQSAGRGRLGRSFFSPDESGVYMSLLLRPVNYTAQQSVMITTMAAVAMCESIIFVSGRPAGIKWVNDIYIGEKKVCGILTEGAFGMENGSLEYAVLGLGINVYTPEGGFPQDIKDIAGPVFLKPARDAKNKLVAEFLNRFFYYYNLDNTDFYIKNYRKYCFVIGKLINVISKNSSKEARVLGIDDSCHLQVCYEDGSTEVLSSGEISIKLPSHFK